MKSGNKYYWDFGDGVTSNIWNPEHTFPMQNNPYRVKMLVVNGNDSCYSYYQVPGMPQSSCEANYSITLSAIQNPKLFGSITVLITDPSGKTFSSRDLIQSATNKFEILQVDEYQSNNLGNSVRKLKIRFNCDLKNGADVLHITDGEAVLGVAYK
jgi:hypothetical protein